MTPDKFTWSAVLVSRRLRRVPGSARLCGRRHVAGPTQVCPNRGGMQPLVLVEDCGPAEFRFCEIGIHAKFAS